MNGHATRPGGSTSSHERGAHGARDAGSQVPLAPEDLMCPICVDTITDAFVTPCGHTFCFKCITTHLGHKRSCPACGQYLTQEQIHPNFLLNRILNKAAATTAGVQQGSLMAALQTALQGGTGGSMDVSDVDAAIQLLQGKRQQIESQESGHKLHLLLLFLQHVRSGKHTEVAELQQQLDCLQRDMEAVEAKQRRSQQPAAGAPAAESGDAAAPAVATGQPGVAHAAAGEGAPRPPQPRPPAPSPRSAAAPGALGSGLRSAFSHVGSSSLHAAAAAAQRAAAPPPALGLRGSAGGAPSSAAPPPSAAPGSGAAAAPSQRGAPAAQAAPQPLASSGSAPAPPAPWHRPLSAQGAPGASGFRPYALQPRAEPSPPPLRASAPPPPPNGGGGGEWDDADGGALAAATAAATEGGPPGGGAERSLCALASGSGGGAAGGEGDADVSPAAKRQRILCHMGELEEAYLQLRGAHLAQQQQQHQRRDSGATGGAGPGSGVDGSSTGATHSGGAGASGGVASGAVAAAGGGTGAGSGAGALDGEHALSMFSEMLMAATHYSRMHLVAQVPAPPPAAGAPAPPRGNSGGNNIISSIAFDPQDRVFATAGVQQRIRLYDYAAVAATPVGGAAPPPELDLSSRHKLSCLAFSPHSAQRLLSSDYQGYVSLWDVGHGQLVREWGGHLRRVWSVDCAPGAPGVFATGSDDGRIKVWSESVPASSLTLDVHANVCSVQFNPSNPHLLAVGSAGHAVLLYDLRAPAEPLRALPGHSKAVSYVRWLDGAHLVSASTDSTLRLWDVAGGGACARVFSGHVNERNFVGLAADGPFIACGSETHEVYVYHRDMPRPCMHHSGGGGGSGVGGMPGGSRAGAPVPPHQRFISAVCWRRGSHVLLAASSTGSVAVLAMKP